MSPELSFYFQLFIVIAADYVWGDPRLLPHPVRFIGRLCVLFERVTREGLSFLSMRARGAVAFFFVLLTTLAALALFFSLLFLMGETAALFGAMVICYFSIAAGDLVAHSNRVYNHLTADDIVGSRQAVSMMVGRDTESLDVPEVTRACVESVSENMVDGITAPLFWAFIGSSVGMILLINPLIGAAFGSMTYKAVNTMDSMYGYRNEKYMDFGWCAARIDDLVNFIPARLSGLCLIGAAYLIGFDGRGAARVYMRDRRKSTSPNSGHSEAAAAGALNIELGGTSSYFGQTSIKDYIGQGLNRVEPGDIKRVNKLILSGSLLFFAVCSFIHFLVVHILR
ncbi:MAG: cobalamin biosynthesis protein CobD [Desulfofustis sp.]|nr:cobalamin biosynthesis protein CobD [Desulfofustis sp.]